MPEGGRVKDRGLFNVVGKINKLLFRSLDSDDEQKYITVIKTLQDD